MYINNPYGAVVDALKDTRLTLKDIAAAALADKKLAAELEAARAEAEVKNAMVNADILRQEGANAMNQASFAEQVRANQAREEAERNRSAIDKYNSETNRMSAEAAIRLHNAQTASLARENAQANELITAKEYASRRGAEFILDMLGIDPQKKLRAHEWSALGNTIDALMKTSPAMYVTATGYKLKQQIEDLDQKYNTPGLPQDIKDKIKQERQEKYFKLKQLDDLVMSINEPDSTKLNESAKKLWMENPGYAAQYKSYDDFLTDYAANLKKTRSKFHDDLAAMQIRAATIDIDPNYNDRVQTALSYVASVDDKKHARMIQNGLERRLREGKLKEAYDYIVNWEQYLKKQQDNKATKSY